MRHVVVRWRHDGNDEAQAGGGQNLAPVAYQPFVGATDVPDVAIEVVKAERVHIAVLLSERRVPVDLVGQRVPGEADGRDTDVPQAKDVGPFLPQPVHQLVADRAFDEVRFRVHDRQAVAVVILPGDLGVAEDLPRRRRVPVLEHAMLVGPVIVVAEDAVLLQPVVKEEVILLLLHAVIHEVFEHVAVDPPAVVQIEAEEAPRVHQFRLVNGGWAVGMKIFRRFRLYEDGVGAVLQDLEHRQHIGLDDVFQRRDEALVRLQLLVPPAVLGREDRADEHLVDRRIELNPRVPFRERRSIVGEQLREVGILEIADPVRNPEMAEVDDRSDVAPPQLREGDVGEFPVVLARAEIGLVDRRTVAEIVDPDLLDAVEILSPFFVVAAQLHLVDARLSIVDRRDAVLDPGREHEVSDDPISLGRRCR